MSTFPAFMGQQNETFIGLKAINRATGFVGQQADKKRNA